MTLGSQPCAGSSSLVSLPLSSPPAVPSPSSSQRMVLNHRSDHVSSLLKCLTGFPPSHSEETPESLGSPALHPPLPSLTRPPPWTPRPALPPPCWDTPSHGSLPHFSLSSNVTFSLRPFMTPVLLFILYIKFSFISIWHI